MSSYECNHCKKVVVHNGSFTEIGFIEVFAAIGKVRVVTLYHEECAKEIARELLEMIKWI